MAEQVIPITEKWSALKRIAFLFGLVYTFLYIFHFLLDNIVRWTGEHILHISGLIKIEMTGSGDTTFDYVALLTISILSIILTSVILIFDRKRDNYLTLLYWFSVCLRYYVGFFMLTYGFAKIFKSQFPFPYLARLEEPYGNSSPMGLLWTFMGYSTGYNIFSGAGEVMGGILLLFRPTTTLGALIVFGVMSNVLMMNFCYDVPVKLFSANLIFFSILLLAPKIKTLFNFFVLNKEVSLSNYIVPIKPMWLGISSTIIKLLVIGLFAFSGFQSMSVYGDNGIKPSLYGIYDTETFIINNDTLQPLATDSIRWNKVIIDNPFTKISAMNEKGRFYKIKVDSINMKIDLTPFRDSIDTQPYHLTYSGSSDYLYATGKWKNDSITVKLHKVDINKYLLVSRGFHWINEYPFNR